MLRFMNAYDRPLGLPYEAGTVNPGDTIVVEDERVVCHAVVRNWVRNGRLTLLDGAATFHEVVEQAKEPTETKANEDPSQAFLKVLDLSIPKVKKALPDLTDEQFDAVVAAEKSGKKRTSLIGEDGVFAKEWERRYGTGG